MKNKKGYSILSTLIALLLAGESQGESMSTSCTIDEPEAGAITSMRKSTQGVLCVLVVTSPDEEGIIPVARSYDGNDWESNASGRFTLLDFECANEVCTINLPSLNENESYLMSEYSHSLSRENELARFLEQATFGTTKKALESFSSDVDVPVMESMAQWIVNQMNHTDATLHREFFRRKANHKFDVDMLGRPYHGCEKHSRYRAYAFSSIDWWKFMEIRQEQGWIVLSVGGYVRTIVSSMNWYSQSHIDTFGNLNTNNMSYRICARPYDLLGGALSLLDPISNRCTSVTCNGVYGNPQVFFDNKIQPIKLLKLSEGEIMSINNRYFTSKDQEILLPRDINDALCQDIASEEDSVPVFVKRIATGTYFIHDPPARLLSNTLTDPAPDGGNNAKTYSDDILCSNVARTFLNEEHCKLSTEISACSANSYAPTLEIELNLPSLRSIYETTKSLNANNNAIETRYVYVINGLRIDSTSNTDPPCQRYGKSRWIPLPDKSTNNCVNDLDGQTITFLSSYLLSSIDTNTKMRDIYVTAANGCTNKDKDKKGFMIFTVDQKNGGATMCWQHVHQDHLQIYDMTYWTRDGTHPGNSNLRNPIKEFAEKNIFTLLFPDHHTMDRWETNRVLFTEVGRWGDKIKFDDLPLVLRTNHIAKIFGGEMYVSQGPGVVVCGSPGEVANDPRLGGGQNYGAFELLTFTNRTTGGNDFMQQKKIVWTMISLHAFDQLRQRVAWALSQILVLAFPNVMVQLSADYSTAYYDIFVRHAFRNFFDIIKEVSYSVAMGENLTYKRSKSTWYSWIQFGKFTYPDENFSREIMQLFTTGPCKLNMDGTTVFNDDGTCVKAYTNADIREYGKVWTGFDARPLRANIETQSTENFVDPMKIFIERRDMFPKMGIDGKYIGDQYPLCADRPKRHFVKKGAKFILLGASPNPERIYQPPEWAVNENTTRVVLEKPNPRIGKESQFLYNHLCNPDSRGICHPKAIVKLTSNIKCLGIECTLDCVKSTFYSETFNICHPKAIVKLTSNIKCLGIECTLDTVKIVQVTPNLYYEYIPSPCVNQAYFPFAKKIVGKFHGDRNLCADPRRDIASASCCGDRWGYAYALGENYWGEVMSYKTAQERCIAKKLFICFKPTANSVCAVPGKRFANCLHDPHYWSTEPCVLKVKVYPENGYVGIVHDVTDRQYVAAWVNQNSFDNFRVHWSNGIYPTPANSCGSSSSCTLVDGGKCLCEVFVMESKVFHSIPSREQALSRLHIGAYDPELLMYQYSEEKDGVILHYKSEKRKFHMSSVFEVVDNYSVKRFLKNQQSNVILKDTKPRLSFRNPPQFITFNDPEVYEAEHETDAALAHYFYHPNTAPFLSHRLLQRFGVSNPSRHYVKRVATAFHSGSYVYNGTRFGDGRYGDMASTIAAILLDRESRSVVLDKDASHGGFHEPLLKVLKFMKAMEFKADNDKTLISLDRMEEKIGQMVYQIPSVFSYYLPTYTPPGRVASASLVSPEAQLGSGPNILGTVNGLFSLIKHGFSNIWEGFFWGRGGTPYRDPGDYTYALGKLTYQPSSTNSDEIVDELSTLLTSGRLSGTNKQIVKNVYDNEPNKTAALMMAQQVIATSPEFHTTGLVDKTGVPRKMPGLPEPASKPYKAVIMLFLSGGADSFNMLVPQCEPLLQQYKDRRLQHALTSQQLLPITENSGTQPCSEFALHYGLPSLQKSYNDGQTLFVANMGVLNTAVDSSNYAIFTKTLLFGHNTMQEESQRADPYNQAKATGILGRLVDEIHEKGTYKVGSIAVQTTPIAVAGRPGKSPRPVIVRKYGTQIFDPYGWQKRPKWSNTDLLSYIKSINSHDTPNSNVFGNTWSDDFLRVIAEGDIMDAALKQATLTQNFNIYDDFSVQLQQVAKLINTQGIRGVEREVFFVEFMGWDHHADLNTYLTSWLGRMNAALDVFWTEMKVQNMDDNVVLVQISEFGRTLSPNGSEGNDHAWGGHYFITGGLVKGKRILGEYPNDLNGPLNVDGNAGHGRFIPTTCFEAVWNAVSQWMGIDDDEALDRIMPNRLTCGGKTGLFTKNDLFK